jgi:hypothetical protein
MKPTVLTMGLLLAALTGCNPSPPTLVPKAPHGGSLFALPETTGRVEVVREDDPARPDKVQIVVYFLDEQFQPLEPTPTAVAFQPKTPRNAPAVELKPTVEAEPAKASGLASPPLDNTGPVAGQISATIAGKPVVVPINVR